MKVQIPISFIITTSLTISCISGCTGDSRLPNSNLDQTAEESYQSVDGIWKCTPATAFQFPHRTLETYLLIGGYEDREMTVRGCFVWEGSFHQDWDLVAFTYDDSTSKFSFTDGDGDRYAGKVGKEFRSINGFIYAGDDPLGAIPLDTLDFERADDSQIVRLFFPREPRSDGTSSYSYCPPESLEDGLPTVQISVFLEDTSALNRLMARIIDQEFGRLESLLIMKEGKLILEEYFYGYDHAQLHNIHSCTKSIASLLLGIVMDQHPESGINSELSQLLPGYDSLLIGGKERITLEHLLTMTAGLSANDIPGLPEYPDQLRTILNHPLESAPGEAFRYNNDNSILLGGILHSITGNHADAIAEEFLFGPLGITEYRWEIINGLPQCHSDLYMLPRDMAKIGQLVLNDGRWGKKQIAPKDWISESTMPHVVESEFFNYGYHWWHRSSSNKPWWEISNSCRIKENDMVVALGFGGQYIMIIRALDMVVVTTSSDYGNGHTARIKIPLVIEEIVPLFEDGNGQVAF